jgi:hypothetical protein
MFSSLSSFLISLFTINRVEKHHNQKKDCPSGTAIMLGQSIAEGRNVNFDDCKTDTLNVTLDAGNLKLKNTDIETLTAKADAGNIESTDCTIKGGSVETDMGNIELNGDIGQVSTKTDLGNVKVNGSKK